MSESTTVLGGVRVLDLGRFIAAPWCAAILADMGADVIRIEKREGGEDRWVQATAEGGEGATFLQCNRNKRSLTLDTTTDEGGAILRSLVEGADVVVANMPLRAMEANGLSYEAPVDPARRDPRRRDRVRRGRPVQLEGSASTAPAR